MASTSPPSSVHRLRVAILKVVPWLITIVALYVAFHNVRWELLIDHLGDGDPLLIFAALLLTCCSYLMRARRWQFLFPEKIMNFVPAVKVLLLGFFMNNVLPARAGEFVRAHIGSKVTGATRTLVLATVASERLADALMLSAMFVLFALGQGNHDLSQKLLYAALFFAVIAIAVIVTLLLRNQIFGLIGRLNTKIDNRASNYTFERVQIFINGLAPLFSPHKLPALVLWSIAIWLVELFAYILITRAFDTHLPLSLCVLFLVAVNFSSLIPAAPGGIGVIEACASTVLFSVGVPYERALTMVITQHVIQYLVVGIPGAFIMATWKKQIKALKEKESQDERE